MTHPALLDTSHRPWPAPTRPWSLTMGWHDLLFLHWRVPAPAMEAHLPPGVELETFDGSAWLGVVPFRMVDTRFRWLPRMPTAHTFPELNLRTYVRVGERRGVWFWSLDAASRLGVEGARLGFGLPYLTARMHCERDGDEVRYRSERTDRRGPSATFVGRWRPAGPFAPAGAGTLEKWLCERYCLFARRRGRLVVGEIAHPPWRLAPAVVQLDVCDMARIVGVPLAGAPASALAAAPIEVVAWSPQVVADRG
jgi:uncharacterized protein YqjF (DUF2071 family)